MYELAIRATRSPSSHIYVLLQTKWLCLVGRVVVVVVRLCAANLYTFSIIQIMFASKQSNENARNGMMPHKQYIATGPLTCDPV